MFVEKTFSVELGDEDLDLKKIKTINDIAELVKHKKQTLLV
jgi:acyl carrier protein